MSTPIGPPLGYEQLRLVAEFAAGIRGGPVNFEYRRTGDGAGEVVLVEAAGTSTATSSFVTADTPRLDGHPAIVRVDVGVAEGNALALANVPGTAGIAAGTPNPDALFWSDSAVLKFLVPYYASARGINAPGFLRDLLGTWFGYPPGMPVVALAHLRTQDYGAPLDFYKTVGVVYVSNPGTGELGMLTLDDFTSAANRLAAAPVPPAPRAVTAPANVSVEPAATPPMPYVLLRRMAEFALGFDNQGLWFGFGPGEEITPFLPGEGAAAPVAFPRMVSTYTPSAVPAPAGYTGRVTTVVVQEAGGGRSSNLATVADSVFWSGAVLQFMLPYYASVFGAYAAATLTAMLDQWGLGPQRETDAVIRDALLSLQRAEADAVLAGAVSGNPLSDALDLSAAGQDAAAGVDLADLLGETGGGADATVVALVHLPRSDWVDANASALGSISLSPDPTALELQPITV